MTFQAVNKPLLGFSIVKTNASEQAYHHHISRHWDKGKVLKCPQFPNKGSGIIITQNSSTTLVETRKE